MNPRVILTYFLLLLYNPKIIFFLRKVLSLKKNPFLYDEYCQNRLKRIILYSYKTTRYYRKIFDDAKLVHNEQVDLSKFGSIPLLSKDTIRSRFDELKSNKSKKTYINTSGGSTGEPVLFVQDITYYTRMVADTILFSLLNGKHPGEKEIKLWGSERDIFEGTIGIKEKLINMFFNRTFLNSFKLSDSISKEYIQDINQQEPVQIWAYADSIFELAQYINRNDIKIFCPKNIICTAGTLYPEIREKIQEAFPHSAVINQYGSREVGQIACQVGDDLSLLIFGHSNFVELVNPDTNTVITEPNKQGKVVVTNLNNFSMPLIRFDIGDIAEYSPNKNNENVQFTHFAGLSGRDNTHFISREGGRIHGEYFTHLFYNRPWIKNFQVIQKSLTEIDALYVKNPELYKNDKDIEEMQEKMRLVLGDDIAVNFIEVDSISKLRSGKYQFVKREF